MQIFPIGRVYDFMAVRVPMIGLSVFVTLASLVLLVYPGPVLGTDFKGGTELEVAFKQPLTDTDIRRAISDAGFSSPDVVHVTDATNPHRFLVRVEEVATISPTDQAAATRAFCFGDGLDEATCPEAARPIDVRFSPGGDRVTLRYPDVPDLVRIKQQASQVSALKLRPVEPNPLVVDVRANKAEVLLQSQGARMMDVLRSGLGAAVVPDSPLRVEWVGPKAGTQLRNSAIKSIALAMVFIMVYLAFRFDIRYAPGAIFSLIHDALGTIGVLTLMRRELSLSSVAAVLTIVGFSVNDTVVVYDRVRENMAKMRGSTFEQVINLSLSETLSRTVLTSGTAELSMVAFFVWGTGELKDFALALIIGMLFGTYSSIYIALPLTAWLDRRFFGGRATGTARPGGSPIKKRQAAVV
jgi:preprotein translocase subunit SecF